MKSLIGSQSPFYAVSERDMDFLLLEELQVSEAFRKWVVKKLYDGEKTISAYHGTWHRPNDAQLGNVDLLFLFEDQKKQLCATLIENKIDAPRKDLQTERYYEIGEKGIQDGAWKDFTACLFSPQSYFGQLDESQYFSSYLSYEDMRDWFSRSDNLRSTFKVDFINQAIEQNRKGYRVPPPGGKSIPEGYKVFPAGALNLPEGYHVVAKSPVKPFWSDYSDFVKKTYPHMNMQDPSSLTSTSVEWAVFHPDDFDEQVRLIHKMSQGFVDLSFGSMPVEQIQATYARYLDGDMVIRPSGNNGLIRINVPAVENAVSFFMVRDIIGFCLQKANKLYKLYMRQKEQADNSTTGGSVSSGGGGGGPGKQHQQQQPDANQQGIYSGFHNRHHTGHD